MSDQLSLDFEARKLAHADDPHTSADAAAANREGKRNNRRRCLVAHREHPLGLTDDEVSELTGLELIEARRRCSDLRNLGDLMWLQDEEGNLVTRKTHLGRSAGVCVIA